MKEKREEPRLPPGLVVDKEALIVDLDGVTWWVRPINMVMVRASGPLAALPASPPEPEHG